MLESVAALPASLARAFPGRTAHRHARSRRRRGRLHRRLLAYRDVQIIHAPAPEAGAESLLLVYIRRVVGQLTYEMCEQCASGVITEVHVASALRDSGLGTRAIAHLRACYPDVAWHNRLTQRTTRDLALRMRLPDTDSGHTCTHQQRTQNPALTPVPARLSRVLED